MVIRLTSITHYVSIPVNGGKLRDLKHEFGERSAGDCSYDVRYSSVAWPDPDNFIANSCANDAP